MPRRHLANANDHKKHSLPLLNRTKNERSYLLKLLTPVIVLVVNNYLTMMSVIVVIC